MSQMPSPGLDRIRSALTTLFETHQAQFDEQGLINFDGSSDEPIGTFSRAISLYPGAGKSRAASWAGTFEVAGCMDDKYVDFNPAATHNNQAACKDLTKSISFNNDFRLYATYDKLKGQVIVNHPGQHKLQISDVKGKILMSKSGLGGTTYNVPKSISHGLYFVNLNIDGQSAVRKIVY